MDTSEPVYRTMPPPALEPASDEPPRAASEEPKRSASADAKAKLKAKGPADERGEHLQHVTLHVGPAAKQLANVASATD
jgi:hypothetical protein